MLRGLFKNNAAKSYVRLAYLTGILTIARFKPPSRINGIINKDAKTLIPLPHTVR